MQLPEANNKPLFTIATITYNASKWVKQAVDSILASSFIDFELIIADDCSTDDTWKIIESFKDKRIQSWRNETNIGEYPNRNKVLQSAKGNYILFVDGDDILYKQTLRNLSEYVFEYPEAASIWGVPSARFWFAVLPYMFYPSNTVRLIYETNINLAEIGFAETLFKTEYLKKIGGFSEEYKIGDTWVKKRLAFEYPILFVPMGFMLWRQSAAQASKKINSIYGGFLQNFQIDQKLLATNNWPIDDKLQQRIYKDVRSSFLKNLVRLTLFKFKLADFMKMFTSQKFSLSDVGLIFRKVHKNYLPISDISQPLVLEENKMDVKIDD
jgi:glycosyltransferase involved in cell wall biosynthesis